DLQIRINGWHTFFLSERVISRYCGKLRKIIRKERRKSQIKRSSIEIVDFPGGAEGFEQVSRFCYSNGGAISITVSNVPLLHCCASFLGMSEMASHLNLLHRTEAFLEGILRWPWSEILTCLKNCEPLIASAESCGLVQKLLCSLLARISDANFPSVSSPSSSSSSEASTSKASSSWWFRDMATLSPRIIEQFLRAAEIKNPTILTRFLLHYLKTANPAAKHASPERYAALADAAALGVAVSSAAFSCRAHFWVLRRTASGFGVSRENRARLEEATGRVLDEAKLDDLLVPGGDDDGGGEVYDVNLVIRLIGLFVVHGCGKSEERLKRVGALIDMYLKEIAPDPNLTVSKFVGVAESLPDIARDSFDHVYRAVDIYLESHPSLSEEDRSRVCSCVNYSKLSLEACKDMAKSPRVPPPVAIRALASQRRPAILETLDGGRFCDLVLYDGGLSETERGFEGEEEVKVNLERMQWRVMELEKVCREMKGQMARMVKLG
ncbi:hypothetical protein M569_06077, partial [Genlisea aurea]